MRIFTDEQLIELGRRINQAMKDAHGANYERAMTELLWHIFGKHATLPAVDPDEPAAPAEAENVVERV